MRNTSMVWSLCFLLFSCIAEKKEGPWQLREVITLEGVNPIGLTHTDEGLWLSDGDRNRLVLVDGQGHILKTIDSLARPMHIESSQNTLFVPLYGNDIVARITKEAVLVLPLNDSLDAPAGISVYGKEIAIADFYNHRILYSEDGKIYSSIGREGKEEGEFHYPTDVQITEDHIWVADAYNNRVQVFNKNGTFEKVIGEDQKMNGATGIFVSPTELFVTDFGNNRVLVFDRQGRLKQTIEEGIEAPTDVLEYMATLYIVNYKGGVLQILERRN